MSKVNCRQKHFFSLLKDRSKAIPSKDAPKAKNHKTRTIRFIFLSFVLCLVLIFVTEAIRIFLPLPVIKQNQEDKTPPFLALKNAFRDNYASLQVLPYSVKGFDFELMSRAAVLVDCTTGNILYEKNQMQLISPASMTKLFVCAIIEKNIQNGVIDPNEKVSLPAECLVQNMPPDASLMVLNAGDTPTVNDLLMGLCVASGNDAAFALAVHNSGSIEKFVQEMNDTAQRLGLFYTHFVEPSGYSADNVTTPLDFATFCLWYIKNFEKSLKTYHSQKTFSYKGHTMTNTNKLLGLLEGVDGLKTGYIEESGFNLALTAKRGQRRFLSVTMGGQGNTTAQGNISRIHDGSLLMNFAFDNFSPFIDTNCCTPHTIKTFAAKNKTATLYQAYPATMSLPKGINLQSRVILENAILLQGDIKAFSTIGKIEFFCDKGVLQKVPLVATCDIILCDNKLERLLDKIIFKIYKKITALKATKQKPQNLPFAKN